LKAGIFIVCFILGIIFTVNTEEYQLPTALDLRSDQKIYPIGWSKDEKHFAYIIHGNYGQYCLKIRDSDANDVILSSCRSALEDAIDENDMVETPFEKFWQTVYLDNKKDLSKYNIIPEAEFELMGNPFNFEGIDYEITSNYETGVLEDTGDTIIYKAEISLQAKKKGVDLDKKVIFYYEHEKECCQKLTGISVDNCLLGPHGKIVIILDICYIDAEREETINSVSLINTKLINLDNDYFVNLLFNTDWNRLDNNNIILHFPDKNKSLVIENIITNKKTEYLIDKIEKDKYTVIIKLKNGKTVNVECISKRCDNFPIVELSGFINAQFKAGGF
jgi:hypothetical protein